MATSAINTAVKMEINLVEATIQDLKTALDSGSLTSTDLVSRYLQRIATYDTRGPCLNSVVLLNPAVFCEAASSDERRANGTSLGPLDGIPYLLKDSFKYSGMTVSAGSPAFRDLLSNEDSHLANVLRKAGAVCIGKTNMPPMACGGMQRGIYGRAESPYNPDYLTAAFCSGSSNGSATATAASFAAFSLGTETVSSGRSPASNNALVAYTPSRGVISCRGVWPLYPTCDVMVPHTRTVADMLTILDVLTQPDPVAKGDFWREQPFVQVDPLIPASYSICADAKAIYGKRFGVPRMYIGGQNEHGKPTYVGQAVIDLWRRARADIESLGGEVIETDFPIVTNYEDDSISKEANNVVGAPTDWNQLERGKIIADTWDDFLVANKDPECPTLASVDGEQLFPKPKDYIPDRFIEKKNMLDYPGLVEYVRRGDRTAILDIPGMEDTLKALEAQRKRDLEDWMDQNNFDAIVFPANGGVGRADLEENEESARHAHLNGVKYSNGNRALRHLGVPTVSVTMGVMHDIQMPVNLTFAGKAYSDEQLLKYAYAFENKSKRRYPPKTTPALPSDTVYPGTGSGQSPSARPELCVVDCQRKHLGGDAYRWDITGTIQANNGIDTEVEVFVDGKRVDSEAVQMLTSGKWSASVEHSPVREGRPQGSDKVLLSDKTMILVLARSGGAVAGAYALA